MSQDALDKAKLEQLIKENEQLNNTVHAFSGQLRARKSIMDSIYEQNINYASINILMEDNVKKLQADIHSLNERIVSLEKEKADLLAEKNKAILDGQEQKPAESPLLGEADC